MERIKTSTTEAVTTDDRASTRKRLELLMHDPVNVTDELVDIRHAHLPPARLRRRTSRTSCACRSMDIRTRNLMTPERLARITAPTLVVWGRENPFGDVPEAELMHEAIPGSRLELFAECGHWPQHEHADRYNTLSIELLTAHTDAP